MKNKLLLRKAPAALLAAAMLLGLAGCGKAQASAPAITNKIPTLSGTAAPAEPPAQNEATAPAQSEAAVQNEVPAPAESEAAAPVQAAPAAPDDRTDLAGLRKEAKREVEWATFATAYLGEQQLDDIGVGPTDNPVLANYSFIETIDAAHRIDISGGAEDGEVYCILPLDPRAGMVVNLVDEETDAVKEEVYRSETGEPILLRCNGGGVWNARVSFDYGNEVENYWPMTATYYGQKHLIGPNGASYYDFTVFPDWKAERDANLPAGDWKAEVLDPLIDFQQITMALRLYSTDAAASLFITDTVSGDYMVGYMGTWELVDEEHLTLELACVENCTGMDEYSVPIKGEYQYSIGVDNSLTISVSGKNSTPFYVNHAYEPISFFLEATGAQPGDYGYDVCRAVLNWYETNKGYRPEYAEVDREENGDLVIRLYDDMGTHILTNGWYRVNPDTLQGFDDMTGEMIDFSDFTDGVM